MCQGYGSQESANCVVKDFSIAVEETHSGRLKTTHRRQDYEDIQPLTHDLRERYKFVMPRRQLK